MRLPVFLTGTAIACVTWSTIFALVGWGFGQTALLALGHIRRYEDVIAGLLVVSVVVVFFVVVRRRRAARLAMENASVE